MKDQSAANILKTRIKAKIKKIASVDICISGSFVRTSRKCGNPSCQCANGGEKHPCCLLTSKVRGKTKAIYIPIDMEQEVEKWVKEHKKIKKLLKEIDEMSGQIIKQHVKTKRAVSNNKKFQNQ